ncbi:MAG: hypothetical protein JWP87_1100 [Labilithrix sp.]|nr:hypothetical protein [Labilithrix sp.]
MYRLPLLGIVLAAGLGAAVMGCRDDAEAKRRASERATAEAEQMAQAQETSLTSASIETKADAQTSADDAMRARGEMIAAFRLEQSDYRARLQRALDQLDQALVRSRKASRGDARVTELRARRDLLKSDLDAVGRATEPDWATLRTKVERDLESGRPGAQILPRTDRTPGEAP